MKTATLFVCRTCDAQSPKWTGQCLECGAWGTMDTARRTPVRQASSAVPAPRPFPLAEAASIDERRAPTGMAEFDRVLGGGFVAGSVVLIGGEPGIGKSTLALMAAAALARAERKVVYVSGEESAGQVKMRAARLAIDGKRLLFLGETDVAAIIASLEAERPALAVIDSVQMLRSDEVPSEAGAVGQVRAAAARLVAFAKAADTALLIVGHVTKDGNVAGPKTLEHLVDAVLSFEGERSHPLRTLRSLKNRFGSTDETGIFEMRDDGLAEIGNPSAYLLESRADAPGSVISCVMEGARPILVEIQALVQKTSFGYPVRRASGIDAARVEMLLAVLARRAGIDLGQYDVYVNAVGGLKVREPAADLAIALAIASAFRQVAFPRGLAAWGEVGLSGEIRPAGAADRRIAEAAMLGIDTVITALPARTPRARPQGPAMRSVKTLGEAVEFASRKP